MTVLGKNFGFNRTEAIELAQSNDLPRTDYLLFIDADETLFADQDFTPLPIKDLLIILMWFMAVCVIDVMLWFRLS